MTAPIEKPLIAKPIKPGSEEKGYDVTELAARIAWLENELMNLSRKVNDFIASHK